MKAKTILVEILILSALGGLASAEWTEPVPVTEVNSEYADWTPFLSFDGLSLYFARGMTSGYYYFRIFEATRQQPYGPFTSVSQVLSSSGQHVFGAWVSTDNLRMYYHAEIESPSIWQLKVSERVSVNDPWPTGADISELNQLGKLHISTLTADELNIFTASYDIPNGWGGYDIWMASRPDRYSQFGPVTNLAGINTAANEVCPSVSPDGLTLLFQSNRNGDWQLFKATRQSLGQPFGNIELLSIPDLPGYTNQHPSLSSDGSTLSFIRLFGNDKSTADIYVSYYILDLDDAVNPILDAIADKLEALDRVNAALEKEWEAYEALQELLDSGDYGDLNKGDIITAMQKIHSSIQHQEQSIDALEKSIENLEDSLAALGWQPPLPVSHWMFDEGKGSKAHDFAGNNHGTIHGATWTTGQVGGALSFDGLDDYVDMADTVKNYLETSYTFSAWIKPKTIPGVHGIAVYRRSILDIGYQILLQLQHNNSDVQFIVGTLGNNAVASYPDALKTNTWYHMAGVREGNTVNVYVNGISGTAGSAMIGTISPDNFKIGANDCCGHGPHAFFDGTIDDVMIFNRALSAQEIQQLYNNGSAGL